MNAKLNVRLIKRQIARQTKCRIYRQIKSQIDSHINKLNRKVKTHISAPNSPMQVNIPLLIFHSNFIILEWFSGSAFASAAASSAVAN